MDVPITRLTISFQLDILWFTILICNSHFLDERNSKKISSLKYISRELIAHVLK